MTNEELAAAQERTDRPIRELTQIAANTFESIQALERIATLHEARLDRTEAAVRALAEETIRTQQEFQAYLRRISPQ